MFFCYCVCTLDLLVLYVHEDGDLSLQHVIRVHVYRWFMIIYIQLCAFAGVCGWLYGWMEPRPHDNKAGVQFFLAWLLDFALFILLVLYFFLLHLLSFWPRCICIGQKRDLKNRNLYVTTARQKALRRCVTLNLIACRFVALSLCTNTQYSSPLLPSESFIAGIETPCKPVSPTNGTSENVNRYMLAAVS
jgi:hypothetical protein